MTPRVAPGSERRHRLDSGTAAPSPRHRLALVSVLLLALPSALVASCSGADPSSDPAPPEAELEGTDPSVAAHIEELTAAVRRAPGSTRAWARLGAAFEVHGFRAEAVMVYERVQAMAPDDFRWPYNLGICRRVDDQQAAAEHFLRAVALKADHVPLLVCLGEALARVDRNDEAEAHFRTATELDPGCAPAWSGLGGVALSKGDTETAIEHLLEAIELAPAYRDPHRMLAQAYRRTGDGSAAEREQRIEATCSDDIPLPDPIRDRLWWEEGRSLEWRTKRAAQYQAAGKPGAAMNVWREGLDHYRRAAALPTATGKTHFTYGVVLANSGSPEQAIPVFRKALELDSAVTETQMNLASCLAQTGDFEEASQVFRAVILNEPDNAGAHYSLGLTLNDARRFEQAAVAFRDLVNLQPEHPHAYARWSFALARAGRLEDALEVCRAGLRAAPDNAGTANQLAWLLAAGPQATYRDGREAVNIARGLCEATEFNDPILLDTLAVASAEVGDFDTAVKMATRAYWRATGKAPESSGPGVSTNTHAGRIKARLDQYFRVGRAFHGPQ